MENLDAVKKEGRIPVSVLTGFLGSGKTTVLNYLLQQPALSNTVVIINEFGEIGLDHELIESTTEDMVLLQSGCLCCTIRGDLVETLRDLYTRRAVGDVSRFDRVIIETTGLADPAPILHTLMTDPLLARHFTVDGVITTVDAANGMQTLDDQFESVKQAAVADRIVLTKTDLVSTEAVQALTGRISTINAGARIIPAHNGMVNPARLLDGGLFNPASKSLDVQAWLNAEAFSEGHDHDHHHDHGHDHGEDQHHQDDKRYPGQHHHDVNRHNFEIKAHCMTFDEPLDGDAFNLWLEVLLSYRGPDVLRIKGIVNIKQLDFPVVIHGVQHVFHPPMRLKKWPSEDRRTRIVFITRNIDEAALKDTLEIMIREEAKTDSPMLYQHAAQAESRL